MLYAIPPVTVIRRAVLEPWVVFAMWRSPYGIEPASWIGGADSRHWPRARVANIRAVRPWSSLLSDPKRR